MTRYTFDQLKKAEQDEDYSAYLESEWELSYEKYCEDNFDEYDYYDYDPESDPDRYDDGDNIYLADCIDPKYFIDAEKSDIAASKSLSDKEEDCLNVDNIDINKFFSDIPF